MAYELNTTATPTPAPIIGLLITHGTPQPN
jgi:hypothetical protein